MSAAADRLDILAGQGLARIARDRAAAITAELGKPERSRARQVRDLGEADAKHAAAAYRRWADRIEATLDTPGGPPPPPSRRRAKPAPDDQLDLGV